MVGIKITTRKAWTLSLEKKSCKLTDNAGAVAHSISQGKRLRRIAFTNEGSLFVWLFSDGPRISGIASSVKQLAIIGKQMVVLVLRKRP